MAWVRLEDNFDEHPKVVDLTDAGFRAFVAGLCYCSRNLTDGYIPAAKVNQLVTRPRVEKELLEVGLWVRCDGGVKVHGYLDYQPAKTEVEAKRERISAARSEAGRAGGKRSAEARKNQE